MCHPFAQVLPASHEASYVSKVDMIEIDGSAGEGGGQMVRSSLALALITGQSIQISNIRGNRSKPGLRRQHLTALKAATEIGGAEVSGAEVGSSQLTFQPRGIQAGEYHFRIGTAGSTTLVLQSILPALCLADQASTVRLEGGTHNAWAPPYEFLTHVYLPLLNRLGPSVTLDLQRHGFHPAGGGEFTARIQPCRTFRGLDLTDRGKLVQRQIIAKVSRLPSHVAERECQTFQRLSNWPGKCAVVEEVESSGPGNIVLAWLQYQHVSELFSKPGQRGIKAEQVAKSVWRQVRDYEKVDAPVGPYLADQLLLPLAIAAHHGRPSQFRTVALTQHSTTHIEILQRFLDATIEVEASEENNVLVRLGVGRNKL